MSDTCMLHARTGTVAFGLLSVGFACAMQGLGEWQLTGARHFLLVHKELRVQAERDEVASGAKEGTVPGRVGCTGRILQGCEAF